MSKSPLTTESLSGLVNTGNEPRTSAPVAHQRERVPTELVNQDNSKVVQYKHSGQVFNIDASLKSTSSKQVSVKMEAEDYTMLRHCAARTDLNHREIFLEAFDLWIRHNAAKLK